MSSWWTAAEGRSNRGAWNLLPTADWAAVALFAEAGWPLVVAVHPISLFVRELASLADVHFAHH